MKNIVLIGFMGTGKSTTGRLLARRLVRPFIDIDRRIEMKAGMSVYDIFKVYGEKHFRELEKQVIFSVSRYTNTIIATGGGAVLDSGNISRLRENGIIVLLTASPEVILERTARRNERPLLAGEDKKARIVSLLNQRQKFYDCADYKIDTSNLMPYVVVDMVVEFLRKGGYLRGRS